jgi:DHA3 family macrolide efflux protein-like MFS transporter
MMWRTMRLFLIIWAGQFVSQIGTALTRFALLVWLYGESGSVFDVALLGFFSFLPAFLISPIAGVWVDRLNRRTVMLLADLIAGLTTVWLLGLYSLGELQTWHLYVAQVLAGAAEAFQSPAYAAATTALVRKEAYGRANGLRSLANNGAMVVSPFLAGLLLQWIGLGGVMVIDLLTFAVAVTTLAITRIPRPQPVDGESDGQPPSGFWAELRAGIEYTRARPGLVGIMLVYTGMNFAAALTYYATLPAMILGRSGGNEFALATVQATLGGSAVVGALIVSIWGGPRRKIHGVLSGAALSFLAGDLLLALGRDLPGWVVGAVASAILVPLIDSCNMAILQAKVAPAMQGRFFSLFHMARQSLIPVGYLAGGLLAERWLEPGMAPGAPLALRFGWLVGDGPGAGIALMFVATALLGGALALAGYLFTAVREIEDQLQDYELTPVAVGQPG